MSFMAMSYIEKLLHFVLSICIFNLCQCNKPQYPTLCVPFTFLPTASRSTALSNCPLSMKKSAQRCNSSGSVLSSRSSEIICSAANCLDVKARSKALENKPAWKDRKSNLRCLTYDGLSTEQSVFMLWACISLHTLKYDLEISHSIKATCKLCNIRACCLPSHL